jgi:hypothetical protein
MRQTWPAWGASQGLTSAVSFFFRNFLAKGPDFVNNTRSFADAARCPSPHETTLELNNQVI